MCLVEVKSDRPINMPILRWDEASQRYLPTTKPKLVPACQTQAMDGQQVFAKSADALKAQASTQEFLLLNHPVDCPICDQAGECKLQDYWLTSQGRGKRKYTEPVHKPKGVRFGETIVYDGERCVMCTRCIRFMDEVAHDHVLDMRERGNRNEIVVSPGRELDNKYTLMTEHVCPVGALTSKDFRFKARVWFLRSQKSICNGCATGCNDYIDFDPRDDKVYRLRPRDNAQVNKFWMCDDGMMSYHRFHQDRVEQSVVRNGTTQHHALNDALRIAASTLQSGEGSRVAVVLSAQHSSEDNLAAVKLAAALGTQWLYLAALPGWEGDKILRNADNNPNRRGATQVAGKMLPPLAGLLDAVKGDQVDGVIVLGGLCAESAEQLAPLREISTVVLASNQGPLSEVASVLLPVAGHHEASGTFVNAAGLAQRTNAAVPPPEGVRPAWETIAALARAMGKDLGFSQLSELRAGLVVGAATEARV
jgi:NADH-quinone oxidoreductase subunit G